MDEFVERRPLVLLGIVHEEIVPEKYFGPDGHWKVAAKKSKQSTIENLKTITHQENDNLMLLDKQKRYLHV
jgi:hypothetical protein